MKNIHILQTDKPSRLFIVEGKLYNYHKPQQGDGVNQINVNIYIPNDEEIKEGDWFVSESLIHKAEEILDCDDDGKLEIHSNGYCNPLSLVKKIILTTDTQLIADGIQPIDDEFLQWFVQNPSCEIVDIGTSLLDGKDGYGYYGKYKIIIPKVENKQELPKTEIDWSRFPKSTQEQVGYVEPKQYPIGGFAPGYYSCKCVNCKTEFMGDKRAVQCKPCAIKITKEESKNICIQTGLPCGMQCLSEEACNMIKPEQKTLDGAIGRNGISDPKLNEIRLDIPNQETLEHTSKFIVFTIPNCEEWVQHSIPLDSFEKADDFCQQFRDKKMSYLICKTLKQGYNGK